MASDPSTRARDKDRDEAIEVVEAAFADGQLSDSDRDLRVERLLRAATLGEIEGYLRDLQGRPSPPPAPPRPAGPAAAQRPTRVPGTRVLPVTAAVVFVVVLATIGAVAVFLVSVVGDAAQDSSTSSAGGAAPEPLDMLTPGEVQRFFDAVEKESGSTKVVSAVVYQEYAIVRFPVGRRGSTTLYEQSVWRGESLDKSPAGGTSTDPLVDLADLDPTVLVRTSRRAARMLPDPEMRYVIVQYGFGPEAAEPVMMAYASDKYATGYLVATFDGHVVRRLEPSA